MYPHNILYKDDRRFHVMYLNTTRHEQMSYLIFSLITSHKKKKILTLERCLAVSRHSLLYSLNYSSTHCYFNAITEIDVYLLSKSLLNNINIKIQGSFLHVRIANDDFILNY